MRILRGDVMSFCRHYHGEKFHALLCDPPYHLYSRRTSGEKDQSGFPGGRTNPSAGGFMGKAWDGGGIAFDPATWAALAEHLHPGAFGMAFASSRGWHRLAVAIEDAGLRIHPSIFGWAYGSGFPKATRIDMQLEQTLCEQRQVGKQRKWFYISDGELMLDKPPFRYGSGADRWHPHRYGLQALKPALEPIIVFQKPYEGKPVECIVETGAGALNIDGGRIGTDETLQGSTVRNDIRGGAYAQGHVPNPGDVPDYRQSSQGRWPANFYLDEEAARRLGEQSGERKAGAPISGDEPSRTGKNAYGHYERVPFQPHTDTGTAARFFFQVNRALDEADPVLYCAKASRKERDAGLDGESKSCGIMEDDNYPIRTGSGNLRDTKRRNSHPTVKPIDLARWLATLLLPPAEYAPRRIVVPFSGSGSEMIGAHLAGWEEIAGIEDEAEYVEIARVRLAHWTNKAEQMALLGAAKC